MRPSDQQIVEALIAKDKQMTHDFFFVMCRPLFYSLIRSIFPYDVEYDELMNEIYIYLMEGDAHRLRTFQGRSSIYQWLKCVAARFFIEKRDGCQLIDDSPSGPLLKEEDIVFDPIGDEEMRSDVQRMLLLVRNPRYRLVLQRLLLEGIGYKDIAAELGTSVANLYNIKKRAWAEFTAIMIKVYENG